MRIQGLDVARSMQIFLATLSHSILAFGAYSNFEMQFFFRLAPPVFIILFGVFLEVIYYRKFKEGKQDIVVHRLLVRAVQCAVLHGVSVVILALAEGYSLMYMVRTILFAGATPYTDILKFYSIVLFVSPAVLIIRNRVGVVATLAVSLFIHIVLYVADFPVLDSFKGMDVLSSFLYGASDMVAGPSVCHGLVFVAFGMLLGKVISKQKSGSYLLNLSSYTSYILVISLLIPLIVFQMNYDGDFLLALSGMEFRNNNNIVFFLFGMLGAVIIFDLSMRIANKLPNNIVDKMSILGKTSLFTFSIGNSFLYLVRDPELNSTFYAIISLCFILIMSHSFYYINQYYVKTKYKDKNGKIYYFIAVGYADKTAGFILKLFNFKKL